MEGPQVHHYARQLRPMAGWTLTDVAGERAAVFDGVRGFRFGTAFGYGKLLMIPIDAPEGDGEGRLIRIHCLMFGDVRIDDDRPGKRLTLEMNVRGRSSRQTHRVRVYLGAARLASPDEIDPAVRRRDVVANDQPKPATIRDCVAVMPDVVVADALLDQDWFPGLGNKIRVEALFRSRIHPMRTMASLNDAEVKRLSKEIRAFTRHFVERIDEVGDRANLGYVAFRKRTCPNCGGSMMNQKVGELQRNVHYCETCQSP